MLRRKKKSSLSPLKAAGLAAGTVTLALLLGGRANPGPQHPKTRSWYRGLDKPGFTPPQIVFPIAWTAIQAALGYSGYRLLRANPSAERTRALALWTANQAGIAGWSEIFFRHRSTGGGTLGAAALGANAAAFVAAAAPVDRRASRLGIPLALWAGFATVLAGEIWRRN